MNLAPLIIFVYNRPEHITKTIEALKSNAFAAESSLFIFSDGNKDERDKKNVDKVRNYISKISGFKEIKITLRVKNLGLADSVISGVTEVIEKYGKAIVLEDDIVTSPYFLKFMNEALEFYKDDKRIFSISGYNFPIKIPESYKHQVYISPRPSSWGWATWKDRWDNAVWKPENVLNIKDKKAVRNLMDKAGKDLAPMLLKSIEGKISSWAVKWAFTHLVNESYCLYPTNSLVRNNGADASGTNFNRVTSRYEVELDESVKDYSLSNKLEYSKELNDKIKRIVRPGILSFVKYRLFNIY
ncbi:MAG: glycosyltransferase [Ignavibacterium sp.]|nr:glycosyltransferase [Ignavibacterium sp.]